VGEVDSIDMARNRTLELLGLSFEDYIAPEPEQWNPETLEIALRRLRALGGAQIRLRATDPSLSNGKEVVLCGRERGLFGGELLVKHVQCQVSHLYTLCDGALFDEALAELVGIDFVSVAEPPTSDHRTVMGALDNDWPRSQLLELITIDGARVSHAMLDVDRDARVGPLVRRLMSVVDERVGAAAPFYSAGPYMPDGIARCFAHELCCALLESLRLPDDVIAAFRAGDTRAIERLAAASPDEGAYDSFDIALMQAVLGNPTRALLDGRWPPTNSGIESAQGRAGLFLVGHEAPGRESFAAWHRHPGQPGATLHRLVSLAAHWSPHAAE
jgi:hypothetical protein